MIKQSGTRNQRYKGFKVKHFLQICALLALCIWMLNQVRDKNGINGIVQNVMSNQHGLIKLGRKDLDHPQVLQGSNAESNETGDVEAEEESKDEESEDDRKKVEGEESEEVEDLIDAEDSDV